MVYVMITSKEEETRNLLDRGLEACNVLYLWHLARAIHTLSSDCCMVKNGAMEKLPWRQFYCLYIIVLAMNGTSEAFLHAIGTEDQLKRSNDMLLVFSLIYITLNILLIRSAGAIGLILANSLNMMFRIIYSGQFIQRYFQGDPSSSFSFRKCFPSGWQILILSGIITVISEKTILDHKNFWATFPVHFAIGFLCFCLSAFVIYRRERVLINRIIRFRNHDHDD
ncbi:hypothetical protein Bca52824_095936 [Brassica carinata]|uniref:Protein RFT1 homolog n=1 Tax=Brassica carinata TaxID=52824 RepID=A0A8X7P1A8_BRACI|nr:hypothetical protein Bca52824_095936 [Brassica carinata]